MNYPELISLIKNILISPYVIAVTAAVIAYLSLVFYVANYRRDGFTPNVKKERKISAKPAPEPEKDSSDKEE